ncbi:MAG TPA: tryptophan halogenase family protein [Xanthobacteraceae bacterium]|jgi:tryptophan halogenase|nr:tryptophan halogenase family protein [Xanthobacteraceae bacterium]
MSAARIETIVIVGGGTAGWMAAIYLNRYMRRMNGKVILVESPTIGTIGVGEATIPSLVRFIRLLNLDEKEFMRRCSATYKLAIKFEDWVQDGITYWHPFGIASGNRVNGLDLFYFWMKRRLEAGSKISYADYCVQTLLADAEKAPLPFGGSSPVWEAGGYAYHLDASALGDYFREIATAEGVVHLFGDVQDVALNDHGDITSLGIGGGRTLSGELFIDCTGFRGRLVEETLKDPWIDWSRFMLCDRAVAMPLPRGDRFAPYTLSKAMPSGWMWRIPLSSRIGNGYVFSSAHISADAATGELIAHSGLRGTRGADPRLINIRIGRRTNFWTRNCIAVGLASGFIEPLESTGIHIIQRSILMLLEYLPDRQINEALRSTYNARMAGLYDEIRDFIVLHYILTQRDEPFWRDARNVPLPDTLRDTLALYDETGRIDNPRLQLFLDANYFYILAGNGRLPRRPIAEADIAPASETWHLLDRVREQNRAFVARMPDHAAYLAELHRKPV